jgi:hypothetical protein
VWIDLKVLETEIAKFMPLITVVAGMIPGKMGDTVLAFLRMVTAPDTLKPVVDLINGISGATPPVMPS